MNTRRNRRRQPTPSPARSPTTASVNNSTSTTRQNSTTMSSNRTPDIKIPKFKGKADQLEVESFITIFESVFEHLDDKQKRLKVLQFLEGDAANSYAIDVLSVPTSDWVFAKEKLIKRYGHCDIPPLTAAMHRRLNFKETVKEYFDDKYKLLRKTTLTEAEMTAMLTEGLPEQYRNIFLGKRFTEVSDWLVLAQDIEAEKNRFSRNRPNTNQRSLQPVNFAEPKPNNNRNNNNRNNGNRNNQNNNSNSSQPPICQICKRRSIKANHWHRECPNRNPNNQNNPPNNNPNNNQNNSNPNPNSATAQPPPATSTLTLQTLNS